MQPGRIAAIVWIALGFGASAHAQIGAGALAVAVVDQAGAAVPGASLTATSMGTGMSRKAMTGGEGGFTFRGLAPGLYQVRVELSGFRPITQEGIRLATGETVRVDIQLNLGGVAEAITVTADAPLLRTETASLGQVVDNKRVTELPLNGRSFMSLATLAPGVAMPPPPAAPFPRINGGRPRTNEYLFDGISVLQPEPGQVAFFPNIDAIQEFKIETNSPPAEFGRFNGGVVNLTTKSGTNAFHGSLFEFVRNEALNARNFFASANPVKPQFRRNQFGGVIGGPVRRNQTFFFADYQGQRQTIGRTIISTVPTALQRQGIFTEAISGRVPAIYDPATTTPVPGGNPARSQFANNTIPASRFDPVARNLLQRYPLPTSAGTANNYRRLENESVDQDQFSFRIDHRFTERDQMFARLTRFEESFIPVTPLPDGSGVTTGTLGPQSTTSWSFASNYQRTLSSNLLNELRIGDTRRSVGRTAAQLNGSVFESIGLPGIPSDAEFPNTVPTFTIGGTAYQQLGSPANTASDFATSVTQIADTLTWQKGRHSIRMGADLRWERLNVIQPPSPTGSFTFSNLFTDLPGVREHRDAVRELPPGAGAAVLDRSPGGSDSEPRAFRGVLRPGRLAAVEPHHAERRPALHAELPLLPKKTTRWPRSTWRRGSSSTWDATAIRASHAQAPQGQFRSALRAGWTGHRQDGGSHRLRHRVDRDGGHYHAVHHAGVSLPPDRQPAHAGQHRAGVYAGQRADGGADSADTERRPRTRRVFGRSRARVGLRAAVEYVAPAGADDEYRRGSRVCRLEDHPRRPSRHESQPADGGSARARRAVAAARREPVLRHHPAVLVARRPDDSRRAAPEAVSAVHDRQPVPQQRGHDDLSRAVYAKLEQRFSRGLSYLVSYTRSKLVDDASSVFDASILTGPVAQLPGGRQLQSHARARLFDGRHPARVRRVGGVGHSRSA